MSDTALCKLLNKGDKKALKKLFDLYYADLYRYALRIIADKEAAEELVQDVFISLWENRKDREVANFKFYLFRAVKNQCINHIKRKTVKNTGSEEEIINTENTAPLPSEQIEVKELASYLEKAIDKLPEKCAHIFLLSRNAEYSYKEIAQELNISEKTVENQIGIALKKLRIMLHKYYEK